MKNKIGLVSILTMIILITSCTGDGKIDHSKTTEVSITTKEIEEENLSFMNDEPLCILYMDEFSWGTGVTKNDGIIYNFITLSQLCENELGFPIKFIKVSEDGRDDNAFAAYINSGQNADLIFPAGMDTLSTHSPTRYYWGHKYIEEEIYMDLTPYLVRFCPEALINFERYPDIKDMCTVNGKTYALYAGMPRISLLSTIIKKELLQKANIDSVTDFKSLYDIMNNLYQGYEPTSEENKIMVEPGVLLQYAIYNAAYYPIDRGDVVIKLNDDLCNPYPIEDTDIPDYLMDEFSGFFNHSYLTPFSTDFNGWNQDIYVTNVPLTFIKNFSRSCNDENFIIFKDYSIFIHNNQRIIISEPDNIKLIMVPRTSEQPEKALIFMQWLMTDMEVADILTFGSQVLNLKHYRYSTSGTIIPEKNNTIYGFCHLIANFSDEAFLCGYREFDIIKKYRSATYEAQYPTLYKKIEAQHINYKLYKDYTLELSYQNSRLHYLLSSIKELMINPDSNINANTMKKELSEIKDTDNKIEIYKNFIKSIVE